MPDQCSWQFFTPRNVIFIKNFEDIRKNAKKFRLGLGLNLRPLEPTEVELPSYPLGHAVPNFFTFGVEMDYISHQSSYFFQELGLTIRNF